MPTLTGIDIMYNKMYKPLLSSKDKIHIHALPVFYESEWIQYLEFAPVKKEIQYLSLIKQKPQIFTNLKKKIM